MVGKRRNVSFGPLYNSIRMAAASLYNVPTVILLYFFRRRRFCRPRHLLTSYNHLLLKTNLLPTTTM